MGVVVSVCTSKRLTGFKLCATTPKNTKQHAITGHPRCKTCEFFLCFQAIIFLGSIVLISQWLLCINCFTPLMSFTGFYTKYEPNNTQQGVQADSTCVIQQCWKLLANNLRPFARGFVVAVEE